MHATYAVILHTEADRSSLMQSGKQLQYGSQWSNSKVGRCLHVTDLETRRGIAVRCIVALLYFGLAAAAFALWYFLSTQLDVVFWVGPWPQSALLLLMLAIASSFLLLTRIRITRYFRFQALRFNEDPSKMRRSCSTQGGKLRPMVMFSAVVALCATGLGIITCVRAVGTANNLRYDCASGDASKARQLQETSDRLVRFQLHCQTSAGNINKQLIHCPGFEKAFQNESAYVSYLMRLEKYETCTGFCKPARALSIRDKIKPHPATSNGEGRNISHHPHASYEGITESDAEPAAVVIGGCSEVVWQRILFASLWIGVSSIVGGLILAGIALLLLEYEYL